MITMGPKSNNKVPLMEIKLNIFTLNCWGITGISKDVKERFEAIGKYLSKSSHNIVCLQEVWNEKDYLGLKDTLKEKLPYSHYFYSGVYGSGLCVFSKWLIQDVFFHQWSLNGYIHKITHGDWFGGKGVGVCRLRCGGRLINVYCTHLHAVYDEVDIYRAHRVLQAQATAELIHLTAEPAVVSILAGDLNSVPNHICYKLITQLPALQDPYDMVCEGSNPAIRTPSGTSDHANNSYSNPMLVEKCPNGQRIDHILFKTGSAWEPTVESFGNPLEDRVPGKPFSYSDHNAVALELRLTHTNTKQPQLCLRQLSNDENLDLTLNEAREICAKAIPLIRASKFIYIVTGLIVVILTFAVIQTCPFHLRYEGFKLPSIAFGFYCFGMAYIWNKMEINSIKAGVSALDNFIQTREQLKDEEALGNYD